ncbi:hypothetical protein VTL71DRAFT_9461 [Oculimacula yallundae]|uniref:Uncharacterized protein n=1 Tax=Oculimacula yallundae TaxID=86028 RepID=A0ABR4BRZ9_9HELO
MHQIHPLRPSYTSNPSLDPFNVPVQLEHRSSFPANSEVLMFEAMVVGGDLLLLALLDFIELCDACEQGFESFSVGIATAAVVIGAYDFGVIECGVRFGERWYVSAKVPDVAN